MKKEQQQHQEQSKNEKTIAETKKGRLFKPSLDSVFESHLPTHVYAMNTDYLMSCK